MKYESFELVLENSITGDRTNLSFGKHATVHDILEVLDETHEDMAKDGGLIGIKRMGFMQTNSRDKYRDLRNEFLTR